jgi:hypothetical protein
VHDLRSNIETVREGSALDLNMLTSIRQRDLLHRDSYDVFVEDNQDRQSRIYHWEYGCLRNKNDGLAFKVGVGTGAALARERINSWAMGVFFRLKTVFNALSNMDRISPSLRLRRNCSAEILPLLTWHFERHNSWHGQVRSCHDLM